MPEFSQKSTTTSGAACRSSTTTGAPSAVATAGRTKPVRRSGDHRRPDHQDQTVTVRDRDTLQQERVAAGSLGQYLLERIGR